VECVRLVRAGLGPEVPILQTVFDPLSMAAKLAGADFPRHLAEHGPQLGAGLERMADDVLAFGRACLAAGADGFFFATQAATPQVMPSERYRRIGLPTARRVAEGLRDGAWLLLFHLHGPQPFFDLADELPVDAVNWHDRETAPDLRAALTRTRRALAAGIHRRGPAGRGEPAAAAAEVRDAIAQTGGRRLIVAPGCVLPSTAPESGLRAARAAVETG
jgi:uroporphyrinogen decarboxylase